MDDFKEELSPYRYLFRGIAILIASILGAILFFYLVGGAPGLKYSILLFCLGFNFFYYYYRKYLSFFPGDEVEIDLKTVPYILYLRSFNDDTETSDPVITGHFFTEEEILINSLERLGVSVAIGRPGEPIPPLGAKRIYVSDDQWKDKVRELSADARIIVFRLGETQGVQWEWEHCLDTIEDIEKLLLVVPVSIASDQEYIDQIVSEIHDHRKETLYGKIDSSQLLKFESIGQLLYFEKNEDGSYTIKQIHKFAKVNTFKLKCAYSWKAFRNIRPDDKEYFMAFSDTIKPESIEMMRYYLEPFFRRYNLSPYNEQEARWTFRLYQFLSYLWTIFAVYMTYIIICDIFGLKK